MTHPRQYAGFCLNMCFNALNRLVLRTNGEITPYKRGDYSVQTGRYKIPLFPIAKPKTGIFFQRVSIIGTIRLIGTPPAPLTRAGRCVNIRYREDARPPADILYYLVSAVMPCSFGSCALTFPNSGAGSGISFKGCQIRKE